jgi:hypothetical protein
VPDAHSVAAWQREPSGNGLGGVGGGGGVSATLASISGAGGDVV